MIKTLLNADEEPPPGIKVVVEETVLSPAPAAENQTVEENSFETPSAEPQRAEEISAIEPTPAAMEGFEVPEDAKFFNREPENIEQTAPVEAEDAPLDEDAESLAALMSEIENLEPEEFDRLEREIANASASESENEINAAPETTENPETPNVSVASAETETSPVETETQTSETAMPENDQTPLQSDWLGNSAMIEEAAEKKSAAAEPAIFQSDYTPPTTGETIRNSGLAWSAGIVFFGAVIFMMIFGWFADLLFGSSPWGLVGGIILGGVIGFIQFFRITAQIFKK